MAMGRYEGRTIRLVGEAEMAAEFRRIRFNLANGEPLCLAGSIVLHDDGTADFVGDAMAYAEPMAHLLDRIDLDSPFSRSTPEFLLSPHCCCCCATECTSAIGECVVIGLLVVDGSPAAAGLLLRDSKPPRVGSAFDATVAETLSRLIRTFRRRSTAERVRLRVA